MEFKPIKRSESIVKLSREHHFSLLFCWKIRQGIKKGIAPSRMMGYARYFWEVNLEQHFKQEEEILFASLPEDAMVARALDEHNAIREAAAALFATPEEEIVMELERFTGQLDKHVRFEERELFPYLEKTLSTSLQEEISGRLRSAHNDPLVDDYEDEFWAR
ncbi:MAG: hemerythrin domain-containing protein [Chitinophagaceae bacterium]|nr:hemerythrin domain-containing protein [Chitinophagaceae bacterium]